MSWSKPPKKVAYVVFVGRIPGIYESWDECRAQTDRYEGARFKGYTIYEDAITAWEAFEEEGTMDVRPAQKDPSRKSNGRRHAGPKMTKALSTIDAYARKLVAEFSGPDGSGSHCNS